MGKKYHIVLLIFSLTFLHSTAVFSTQSKPNNYVISHYGMEEGLPQSTVNDITQTDDGYMWLATFGGLVRFDGNEFTTYNRTNTNEMRSDRILHLYKDSNDILWVSSENGFMRYKDGVFKSFVFKLGSNIYAPSKVTEDHVGRLWLTVGHVPYLYDGKDFHSVPVQTDHLARTEALNDSNGVWLGTEKRLLKTTGDSVVLIENLQGRIDYNIVDIVEYPAGSGKVFLATTGQGVGIYEDGQLELYSVESGLSSRYTSKFTVDRSNNLWVTSFNGVSRWQNGNFEPLDAIDLSKDIQYTRIYEDREGNYWLGSPSQGLFKIRHSIIATIDSEDGLWNEKMLSLTKLENGTYLFGTNCGGVYEWSNNGAAPSPINEYLPNLCVWSVYQDSRGDIWFGSKGLYRSSSLSEPGIRFGSDDGFDGIDVFVIKEDHKGNIWVGSLEGLYVYDGESFSAYTTEDGLSYNDTRTLYEDEDGTMWVGTSQGLNKISNGKVTTIDLLADQAEADEARQPYIRAIHEDTDGVFWIGTYGNGLFRIENGIIDHIGSDDGLYDDIISFIREDKQGYFWMGSNLGLFRTSKTALNSFSAGEADRVQSFSYGTEEGMKSAETNGGFQPNVIQESEKLFIPTVAGVAVVAVNEAESMPEPPPVYIERLVSGNTELPMNDQINLHYDEAFLQVEYTALNFRSPEKVKFRYKLEGLHKNWFEVGNRREALFTKIPPGDYTFKVSANNNNGKWNPEVASFGVTVTPPFWMTTWFYGLVALGFLLSGSGIYYVRIRTLKEQNKRQKIFTEKLITSQEEERSRIATELHDSLGQQIMIIKNRAELAKMHVDDDGPTAGELSKIIKSAQLSISSVRSITHNLRPVHLEKFGLTDAIKQLCEQLHNTSSISWNCNMDNIDTYIEHGKSINFYRIIQEGTNNILKHSSATKALVAVRKRKMGITAFVWDNGQGFDRIEQQKSTGLGFKGMSERIESLGGTMKVKTELGRGTTLEFQIPIVPHE